MTQQRFKQTAVNYYDSNASHPNLKQVAGYGHNNPAARDKAVTSASANNSNQKNLMQNPGEGYNSTSLRDSIKGAKPTLSNSPDQFTIDSDAFGKFIEQNAD